MLTLILSYMLYAICIEILGDMIIDLISAIHYSKVCVVGNKFVRVVVMTDTNQRPVGILFIMSAFPNVGGSTHSVGSVTG